VLTGEILAVNVTVVPNVTLLILMLFVLEAVIVGVTDTLGAPIYIPTAGVPVTVPAKDNVVPIIFEFKLVNVLPVNDIPGATVPLDTVPIVNVVPDRLEPVETNVFDPVMYNGLLKIVPPDTYGVCKVLTSCT
jgi:hypothetical protein